MTDELSRCRLCGCEEGNKKFRNIFDGEPGTGLQMKINKLLPIVVIQWDPLPHGICESCIEKVNFMDRFYDDTNRVDRFLRGLMPFIPKYKVESVEPILKIQNLTKYYGHHLKTVSGGPEVPKIVAKEKTAPKKPTKTLECFIINPITNTDSVFTCRECYRTYTTSASALSHMCVDSQEIESEAEEEEEVNIESPVQENPLPPLRIRLFTSTTEFHFCDFCNVSFTRKSALLAHQKKHYEMESENDSQNDEPESAPKKKRKRKSRDSVPESCKKKFSCGVCALSLATKTDLDRHVKTHDVENNRPSEEDVEIEVVDYLVKGKTQHLCLFCPEKFMEHEDFVQHQKDHLESKKIQNGDAGPEDLKPNPGKRSDSECEIHDSPIKTETEVYMCQSCDKTFTRRSSFLAHEQSHCMEKYNYKFSDEEDNEVESDDEIDVEWCSKSKKSDPDKSELHVHVCNLCNMTFSRKSPYIAHEQSHCVEEYNYKFSDDEDDDEQKKPKRRKTADKDCSS